MTAGQDALPLTLGITGHRDALDSTDGALVAQLRSLFEQLLAAHPHTPLELLSPLAEGADQIAARALLSLADTGRVRLIAVLPMPRELYAQDFDAAAQPQFDELLGRAARVIELPLHASTTAEAVARPGPARDRQYRDAGRFVSQQSQLLLALWDGTDNGTVGGTADIVRYRERGHATDTDESLLDLDERGPTWHLVTPRRQHAGDPARCIPAAPYTARWLYPPMVRGDLDPQHYYPGLWLALDRYNRDLAALQADGAAAIPACADAVIPDAAMQPLPAAVDVLRQRYAQADALAIRLQRRWRGIQRVIHVCALVSVVLLEAGQFAGDVFDGRGQFAAFCGTFLFALLSFVAWRAGTRTQLQDRYLDYRALAEGLRVQLFWTLAGIDDAVADRYLGRQRNALDWIRRALRAAALGVATPLQPGMVPHVHAYWVRSQHEYYRAAGDRRRDARVARASHLLLGAGLIGFIALLTTTAMDAAPLWRATSMAAFVLPVAMAGILDHYAQRMAYAEHAHLYGRMSRLFDYALQRLTEALRAGDVEAQRRVTRELGLAALEENGSWVQLHRERPLEMLHPG